MESEKSLKKSLEDLTKEEQELKREINELVKSREKAIQAERRKANRVEILRGIANRLREAPETVEDSDGEEEMNAIFRKIRDKSQNTVNFKDKIIITNKKEDLSVSFIADASIKSNKPLSEWKNKHIKITYCVENGSIIRDAHAEWADEKLFNPSKESEIQQTTEQPASIRFSNDEDRDLNAEREKNDTKTQAEDTKRKTKRTQTKAEVKENPVVKIT